MDELARVARRWSAVHNILQSCAVVETKLGLDPMLLDCLDDALRDYLQEPGEGGIDSVYQEAATFWDAAARAVTSR